MGERTGGVNQSLLRQALSTIGNILLAYFADVSGAREVLRQASARARLIRIWIP
jgi:hypothetical protein